MSYEEFILPFVSSLIITLAVTPYFIRKFKAMGIAGKDVHKKDNRLVAEMGGIPILIGFIVGFLFVIFYFLPQTIELIAIFATMLLAGIVGIIDDTRGMRQKVKAIIPVFAALPLMLIQAGHHEMVVPFIGQIDFGIIYPLIFIPAAITVVSNAFNMLAGYNGLEAGLGFISTIFMGIASYMVGSYLVAAYMFGLAGALLGFLYFNKYSAKIFPGDSGVFIIGSAIATGAIVANLEVVGIILILPHIVNGAITSIDILRGKPIEKFAKVDNDGYLKPPSRKYVYNLYYTLANLRKTTEKQIVWEFWIMEILCGIAAVVVITII
ncbi:MAG: hypothetical protein GXO64_02875 [Candidatus Micrarchaeota archaeon]|nr:hypothetical protein [Candidatus Micrarchaeota archaeon]